MGTGSPARRTQLTSRSPQTRCESCGQVRSVSRTMGGHMNCFGCGASITTAFRDGIPMSVWRSLVDNEDPNGRVPKDRGWTPA